MISAVGSAGSLFALSWGNSAATGDGRARARDEDTATGGTSGTAPGTTVGAEANPGTSPAMGTRGTGSAADGKDKSAMAAAQETRAVQELKAIDRRVRAHEAAHLAAAGGLATSGASYGFRRGPDGQLYAVSGEVSIDMSPGRTPAETSAKADRIRAAALAPADPSSQDRAVASAAAQMKLRAQMDLAKERMAAAAPASRSAAPESQSAAPESRSAGQESRTGDPGPRPGTTNIPDLVAAIAGAGPRLGGLIDVVAG